MGYVHEPMLLRLLVAASVALMILTATGEAAPPKPIGWATYGGGLQSRNDATGASFTLANAAKVKQAWVTRLDATVYAPPLVAAVGGKPCLYVETQADSVYALDPATGKVLWRTSIGPPVQTVCGSAFGISSAPGLDVARNRLYVVGSPGVLVALTMTTGRPVPGWRVRVADHPTAQYVWSSVRLVGSTAYVATASYCDKPDANGQAAGGLLDAIDVRNRSIVHTFDVIPGPDNLGGIWGWGGVSVDAGAVYTTTGNAVVVRNDNLIESQPDAERVLKLSSALKLLRASAVPPLAPNNLGDEDFGSTPLLFQPSGCRPLLAANSKDGRVLVYDRSSLQVV